MKIAVLGSGQVGTTLGAGLAGRGHEVRLGTGSPERENVRDWVTSTGNGVVALPFDEAARWGELVVLATLGLQTPALLERLGAELFAGKVVIDTTNPVAVGPEGPESGITGADSLGEQIQRAVPGALVVKAFNTVGAPLMVGPDLPGGPPTMFLAGDDDAAKRTVSALVEALGWEPLDMGGIRASRLLEPLCFAWVTIGLRAGSWGHAFKVLRAELINLFRPGRVSQKTQLTYASRTCSEEVMVRVQSREKLRRGDGARRLGALAGLGDLPAGITCGQAGTGGDQRARGVSAYRAKHANLGTRCPVTGQRVVGPALWRAAVEYAGQGRRERTEGCRECRE